MGADWIRVGGEALDGPSPRLLRGAAGRFASWRAWEVTGGLSRTTKMPCHSWGLPARSCLTGSRLRTLEGAVCHDCYAHRGSYRFARVRAAYERRLVLSEHPEWVEAMATLIALQAVVNGEPSFRWFDTGDLQSVGMLERIVAVARSTPGVRHWLPTKEHGFVREYLDRDDVPANLTVRLSAHFVDESPPVLGGLPTTTVHRLQPPYGVPCSAYADHPARCGACRDCWDPDVPNISYPYH